MKRYDYVLALLALIATGCWVGCGANKPTDQGAMVALDGTPTSIEPRGEPAAVFESKPAAQRTLPALEDPLRQELVRAYQRAGAAAGISVLPDERLDLAMDDLARALGDGDRPRSEAVEFLLGFRGIIEPYPELVVAVANEDAYKQVIEALVSSATFPRSMVTMGVGVDRSRTMHKIIVAIQDKHLDLMPVARQQPANATFELEGTLLGSFSNPTLYVTSPDGHPSERPLLTNGVAFRAAVACNRGDGTYQVELFGSDNSGPRVLANFEVFCGTKAPVSMAGRGGHLPEAVTADDAEIQLFAHVNEARMNAGLSLLTPDPALARVARGHSGDMFANNFVAHVSPTTGGPGDRVAKAGLKPPRLLENVGTDSSPAEVHRGLMRSPGHRSAILDPEVTHVGIGVVVAPPGAPYRVVVTELFR